MGILPSSFMSSGISLFASEEYVKRNKIQGIKILASAVAQDYLALHSRYIVVRQAGKVRYQAADVILCIYGAAKGVASIQDLDVLGVYACTLMSCWSLISFRL